MTLEDGWIEKEYKGVKYRKMPIYDESLKEAKAVCECGYNQKYMSPKLADAGIRRHIEENSEHQVKPYNITERETFDKDKGDFVTHYQIEFDKKKEPVTAVVRDGETKDLETREEAKEVAEKILKEKSWLSGD